MKKQKQCNRCNKLLPASVKYFYRDHRNKDGFRYQCIKCCAEMAKNRWQRIKESKPNDKEKEISMKEFGKLLDQRMVEHRIPYDPTWT